MAKESHYDLSKLRKRQGVGAVGPQILASNTCGNDNPSLEDEHPSCYRFKEYPMGLTSDSDVPAGGTVTVEVTPQIKFKGDRIMIPSSIAPSFDVLDIKVGKSSQLPTSEDALAGEAFSEVAQGACVDMDTAPANSKVSMTVRNKDVVPLTFQAVIFGVALDS